MGSFDRWMFISPNPRNSSGYDIANIAQASSYFYGTICGWRLSCDRKVHFILTWKRSKLGQTKDQGCHQLYKTPSLLGSEGQQFIWLFLYFIYVWIELVGSIQTAASSFDRPISWRAQCPGRCWCWHSPVAGETFPSPLLKNQTFLTMAFLPFHNC